MSVRILTGALFAWLVAGASAAAQGPARAFERDPCAGTSPSAVPTGFVDCNGNGVADACDVLGHAPLGRSAANLGASSALLSAAVPGLFAFPGGQTGTSVATIPGGNVLETDLGGPVPYTNRAVVSGAPWFGPASRYYTLKGEGVFALVAEDVTIDELSVSTGSMSRLDAGELVFNGVEHAVLWARSGRDDLAYGIVVVPARLEDLDQSQTGSEHDVGNLGGVRRLYYLLTAQRQNAPDPVLDDEDVLALARSLLELAVDPASADCNANGVPDECDLASGRSADCNANGIPDECEPDCNANGVPDDCDLASGASADCDGDGTPDECELLETERVFAGPLAPFTFITSQGFTVASLRPSRGDVALRYWTDTNLTSLLVYANGIQLGIGLESNFCSPFGGSVELDRAAFDALALTGPVTFEMALPIAKHVFCFGSLRTLLEYPVDGGDCNGNGVPDACDVASGVSLDADRDGVPDECQDEEVLLRLVPRRSAGLADVASVLPAPESSYRSDETFAVEVWATARGAGGLVAVYANLVHDAERLSLLSVQNRPPFTLLPGNATFPGLAADLGGADVSFSCPGLGPQWARVAVVTYQATERCGQAELVLLPAEGGVGVCGGGPAGVSYGSARVQLSEACVFDLTGDGLVDGNDLSAFLLCFQTGPGDPGFDPACDLDCSGFVGAGDLAWLSAALGRSCGSFDEDELPPCRQCDGGPSSSVAAPLVLGLARPAGGALAEGRPFELVVELDAPDALAAFVDLRWDPERLSLVSWELARGFADLPSRRVERVPGGLRGLGGVDLAGRNDGRLARLRFAPLCPGPSLVEVAPAAAGVATAARRRATAVGGSYRLEVR